MSSSNTKRSAPKDFKYEVDFDLAVLYTHKDGQILLVEYKEFKTMDIEKAKIIVEQVYPFVSKGYTLVIDDLRNAYHNLDQEANQLLSNNKSLAFNKAHAVLVKSLPSRIATNFFIKFKKPKVPFKMFSGMNSAIKWLNGFKD